MTAFTFILFTGVMIIMTMSKIAIGFQPQSQFRKMPSRLPPSTMYRPILPLSITSLHTSSVTTDTRQDTIRDAVPSTMEEAIRTFVLAGDHGPVYVSVVILAFTAWRAQMSPLEFADGLVFLATTLFWSFQEHILHDKVLHSDQEWFGKEIHEQHHARPYYHVSIDPAPLLLGWMFIAHFAFRMLLPLPLAVTATIAYSLSGMFYEWAHYIVHTKVRFRSKFWKRVKENHLRHHVVSDEFWFAFSIPFIDDLFHTNPSVVEVKQQLLKEKPPK